MIKIVVIRVNFLFAKVYNLKGSCDLWNMSVQVSDLTVTQGIVAKSGYTDSTLSMERLVTWDSLKGIPSFSRGPKVCKIIHKMSWLATLKIFLEVIDYVKLKNKVLILNSNPFVKYDHILEGYIGGIYW